MHLKVHHKGHMPRQPLCIFFFSLSQYPFILIWPRTPGAQRTALWVLHSGAKQLHWTVTDFPGDGRLTNKGHPHEWINTALMRRRNLAHPQKQHWTKGTFIIVSERTVWDCADLPYDNTRATTLWPNLKITRHQERNFRFQSSEGSSVGHSCNTKHLFCPSCYFSKGAISKMQCWVWVWRRQSLKLWLGSLVRPQATAWQTWENPECLASNHALKTGQICCAVFLRLSMNYHQTRHENSLNEDVQFYSVTSVIPQLWVQEDVGLEDGWMDGHLSFSCVISKLEHNGGHNSEIAVALWFQSPQNGCCQQRKKRKLKKKKGGKWKTAAKLIL